HDAAALEDDALVDEDLRGLDVAADGAAAVDLHQVGRPNVADEGAPTDDQRAHVHRGLDERAVAQDEHALAEDVALEATIDANAAFESELALVLRTTAEQGVDLSEAGQVLVRHRSVRVLAEVFGPARGAADVATARRARRGGAAGDGT